MSGQTIHGNDAGGGHPEVLTDAAGRLIVLVAGGGGGSMIVLPDTAAVTAYPIAGLVNGTPVWVVSLLDWVVLSAASVEALSETCFATSTGVGRWKRVCQPADHWRSQATWHINQAAGLINNDGATPATAIPSYGEWERRTGRRMNQTTDVWFDVNYAGDLSLRADEPWPLGDINIRGVAPTVLYSGSVTGAVQWNPAAGTRGTITDAALPVSWTASGLMQARITLTGGPNAGAQAWALVDLGGKTVEHSPFWLGYVTVHPTPGDTFDVEQLVTIDGTVYTSGGDIYGLLDLKIAPSAPGATTVWLFGGELQAISCDFAGGVDITIERSASFMPQACRVGVPVHSNHQGGELFASGCAFLRHISFEGGGVAYFQNGDSIVQHLAGGGHPYLTGSIQVTSGTNLGVLDTTTAIAVRQSLIDAPCEFAGLLWGTGNTLQHAVRVDVGAGVARYTTLPTLAGSTVSDVDLGGTHLAWAGLPAFNPVVFAGMVT